MDSIKRSDGREQTEMRAVSVKLGHLTRADGSARFSVGSTSAVASCSGPLEVRLREELPDRATIEVSHRPLEGVGATPSRSLEAALSAAFAPLLALHQHPRSLVQIVCQSLSPTSQSYADTSASTSYDTAPASHSWPSSSSAPVSSDSSSTSPVTSISFSDRCAAFNAVTLSTLDAGSIAIRAVPVAVSLAYVPSSAYLDTTGGQSGSGEVEVDLVVDASDEEERRATSRFAFAWAFGAGISSAPPARGPAGREGMDVDDNQTGNEGLEAELVWSECEGSFSRTEFLSALDLSRSAAQRLLGVLRTQLGDHLLSLSR